VGAPGKLGLNVNQPAAFVGYTLIAPLRSTKTYLVDMEGRVVREWTSQYGAGQDAYLLENGNLLRAAHMSDDEMLFAGASQGGRIQEFTWDGELVWDFKFHDERYLRHHAITRMPNGNIMMIVWERKSADECVAAGVNPEYANGDILVDCLIEVKPNGKMGGDVVWEWHLWDHLVQDHDKTKDNFGDVAAHPELVDANYARSRGGFFGNFARDFGGRDMDGEAKGAAKAREGQTDEAVKRLQGLGYVGTSRGPRMPIADWNHVNGVSYNAKLDQVMISPREFNEVWIIDHSTTTVEAASHRGGRSGKGGDLLYRWGNPEAYRAGTKADQQLFSQHDTHWIPDGLPGAGHMLVFNNGGSRGYSSVDEVVLPPVDSQGNYPLERGRPYGPDSPTWTYTTENRKDFMAPLMSGAQRLPNGNTLICTGFSGEVFEVTPNKELVWKLIVPEDRAAAGPNFGPPRRGAGPNFGPPGQRAEGQAPNFGPPGRPAGGPPGFPPGFGPPGASSNLVALLPGPMRFMMQLEPDQMEKLDRMEKEFSEQLKKLLTKKQHDTWDKARAGQPPFSVPDNDRVAELLPKSIQEKLSLTAQQEQELGRLETSLDDQLDKIISEEQKERMKGVMAMARQFMGGGRPGGGRGFGPPGFPGFGGTPGAAAVFRAYRYGADFSGLNGRNLQPGKPLVEFVKQ
jgi:hypothetical protein